MNQEVKQQWIEALRSGNYVQGKGKLCEDFGGVNKYCCLGVLTDLFVKAHPNSYKWYKVGNYFGLNSDDGKNFGLNYLSNPVIEWAGLETDSPTALTKNRMFNLADSNDKGVSFTEIADIIEKHL